MKWQILPSASPRLLSQYPDIPALLAQLLHNRGVVEPSDIEVFLSADRRLEHDPSLLTEIDKAVARIIRAVLGGETIAVFGDFDADGVTATALLVKGLEEIGARVIPYIPHRVKEGHGLNIPALQHLHQRGANLVISVDCGITANIEAAEMPRIGLDLVITDHHEVIGPLPEALAVVNPKRRDSAYPFRELAGVGVAFKLLQAVFRATGREGQENAFLDLVALGTVADMVPLLGENRYLVKRGLEVLNATGRLGLRKMIACAGRELGQLDAESIAYVMAPRLNAAGRLDHASVSYNLLTVDSHDEAMRLAELLDLRNAERQRLTSQFLALAEEKLTPIELSGPLLMVADEQFRAGVNGVVAGKLSDRYYRPAIVVEVGGEESMGSARSIPEFNIVAALSECRGLLSHFGGHAQAAGFGIPNENLATLRQRLIEIAERDLAGIDLQPTINIDAEIPLASVNAETLRQVNKLQPFGQGNAAPTFLSRSVRVIDSRKVGSDGDHVKFKLGDRGTSWDAIGFGLNHLNGDNPPLIDIVYNLKLNTWGGRDSLELEILDFRHSVVR